MRGLQCQRTRRYLGEDARKPGGVWVCPHCEDHETYRQASTFDPELTELVEHAVGCARDLFEKSDDGLDTHVFLGESPETVYEASQDAFHIYLDRSSNWLQLAYSAGHEALHRVCSKNESSGQWADEMLAVHFALWYLDHTGRSDHAILCRRLLHEQAKQCSREDAFSRRDYPAGFYGQCLLIGDDLIEIAGWDSFIRVPAHYTTEGIPDVQAWIASLAKERQTPVKRVLASGLDAPPE